MQTTSYATNESDAAWIGIIKRIEEAYRQILERRAGICILLPSTARTRQRP